MSQYEIDIALEGAGLYVSEDAPALSGVALENLIAQYNGVQKLIERFKPSLPNIIT
ncbi:DNA gyrase subunit B [Mannheimia haemolytica]|uniref:DNA gyrase subunit B n=1 Tax=Mannheimia haemolytica TaxID=75985 RepID=A0A378N6V2_MANHA|nr:DNA gyrase subunit B [Mannheimia haemolytica]